MTRTCHLLLTGLLLAPALHAATLTVTSTADSGAGSLRAAIVQANATPAADSIVFNIGSSLFRLGRVREAVPELERFLSISTSDEERGDRAQATEMIATSPLCAVSTG